MKTATLKELGLEGVENTCGFPAEYVSLVGRDKWKVSYIEYRPTSDSYSVISHTLSNPPPLLQEALIDERVIRIVKERPLDVDTLKKCILTLVSSNSNWGMSLSEEDETFVNDILKRIEGE